MKNIWMKFWPYIIVIALWAIAACVIAECDRGLKKENEQLREELTRQQQYVPLKRDTIRDSVIMVSQKIVEVEKVKEVLTKEDKALLKDLGTKVSALEAYQKMSTETQASVVLSSDTIATNGTAGASNGQSDSKSDGGQDSLLSYKDAWLDLKYNSLNKNLVIRLQDSLAIAVEKEYKKRFLWWRWGTRGYQVKAVSFCPYTTIRYNTYVKRKR